MKKLLTSFVLLAFTIHSFSQDENNLKNFRFGLLAVPSLNWYKPDDAKKFTKNGSKIGFGWGLQTEFRLNGLISLVTGLQVNYDRGDLTFNDTTNYFYDKKNQVILQISDTGAKSFTAYKLNSRYYKTTYVMIPLYLKMKTKEIGAMTYYGEFGLNTGIRLKSKVNDNVSAYTNYQKPNKGLDAPVDLSDLAMTDDMNLFKLALHIGGGAEYNLSGSTSLFFGLAYNLGFSNVLKKDSKYLTKWNYSSVPSNNLVTTTLQKAVGNNFALTVGILF